MTLTEHLAAEQAALAALPHRGATDEEMADFYGGQRVYEECRSSEWEPANSAIYLPVHDDAGNPVEDENGRRKHTRFAAVQCRRCYLKVIAGNEPERHSRLLHDYEQGERIVGMVAEVLGMDPWADGALSARTAARDHRAGGVDGRVAAALPYLTAVLIRRDAAAGVARGLADLANLTLEHAEHPFFTEATLYDLLGKDDARTVLAYVRALARAAGAEAH